MKSATYSEISGANKGFYGLLCVLGIIVLAAIAAAWRMEHLGHYITGMSNRIVWGMPHVFAVFLIVAASGALNVASIASVFGRVTYKPLARLSGLVAIALLIGGLSVLVLDLGRPDRLIVAMTQYNFRSIFAWNIFLYVSFLAIVAAYLWMQMEWRMDRLVLVVGWVAFVWRLVLTTGTGLIFGFLVARQAYDAAIMAPMFIAMSFAFGLAVYILVLMAACGGSARKLGGKLLRQLGRLLGVFVCVVLYLVAVQHVTNIYAAEHWDVERFILLQGGIYTILFWAGQVVAGGLVPLALIYHPVLASRRSLAIAAGLVILGGFAQIYVIIIGGQAFPLVLFPGMEVTSPLLDGQVAFYSPSLVEVTLGIGGVALAGVVVMVGLRVLRFLPDTLSDAATDQHHPAPATQPAGA